MKKVIIVLFVLLLTISCASTRNQWRQRNEKIQFRQVEFYMAKYVDEETLETKCKYVYDAELPTVYALSEKEMRAKFGKDIYGKYFPKTNEIYYIKGEWETLGHEYLHRLNATLTPEALKQQPDTLIYITQSRQTYRCLNEVSADFLDALLRKEEEIRRLKRYIREVRSNPNR